LLLFGLNLFNYIDRQALYAVFPLIKTDLSLSDSMLGIIASAFMVVYMTCAPFTGYFGDRMRRQFWIGASALVWSVATLCTGFAGNYAHLLMARSAVGVGEAGFTAIAPSFVSEHFSRMSRARVLALFSVALPLGSALGYLLGGQLGQHFGWRAAFLFVAVPGFILGLLAFFFRDPQRDCPTPEKPPSFSQYKALLKNKVYVNTTLSQAMSTFTLGALAAWMPSYFNRYFGYSVAEAGLVFGGLTISAGVIGTLLGGFLSDRFLKTNESAYFTVAWISLALSLPVCVAGVWTHVPTTAIGFLFLSEILVFMQSGPLNAALVTYTPLSMRSMAFAANIFVIHALGDALSPTLVGIVSDMSGLRIAVTLALLFLGMAAYFAKRAERFSAGAPTA